jgi:hypothetical protein
MIAMLQHKGAITVLLIFAAIAGATAQDTAKQQLKHQLGINATIFVKEFLSFNSISDVADNPYLLTYKYMMGNTSALRAGAGIRLLSQKQSSSALTNVPDSTLLNYYLRVGYEKQFTLTKHWIGYIGGDIRWEYEKTVSKTTVASIPPNQVSTVTTKNTALGAGPVVGIEFLINRRLSLSAGGALLYFYKEKRQTAEDSRYPSLTTNDYTATNNTAIILPTTIYFIIKI